MAIVVAVIGVLTVIAVPRIDAWFENIRVKSAARSAADAFALARSEAMRTGNNHVVFFGPPGTVDPAGNPIQDLSGDWVPVLILNDGPPATANCRIDGGETREPVQPTRDVAFGISLATGPVPSDPGGGPHASGVTFTDPGNTPVHWVVFRPDGIPVSFTGAGGTCGTTGNTGTGGGGLYVTNGRLDYAVVLTHLGGVRVHSWGPLSWGG